MAVLRLLLLAGVCSAATVDSDAHGLFQREIGVHGPEGGPEEPPVAALGRINASAHKQLLSSAVALVERAAALVAAVESPVEMVLSQPVHSYEHWTAEKMAVFGAGYALAARDPRLQPLVNETVRQLCSACVELGAKLEKIAGGLEKNTKSVSTQKLATKLTQISVQQVSEVMVGGMGGVFDALSDFLPKLPTTFLWAATKDFAFFVKHHTSKPLDAFNRKELQPFIKRAFEEEDVCGHLEVKVADFGKMADAIRSTASGSLSGMREDLSALEPGLAAVDPKVVPQLLANTRQWFDDLASALSTVGNGFGAYHEALGRVAREKLGCGSRK